MYTYEDLVAALQSGKTVDDIAAQMTKDLNAAKAEYDRQAAEKAAAANLNRKRALTTEMFELMIEYLNEFHPNSTIGQIIAEEGGSLDLETVDKLIDEIDGLVKTFDAFGQLETLMKQMPADPKNQNNNPKKDPLEDFLNKFVR